MLFFKKKTGAKKAVLAKLNEGHMYLDNNYRDLAVSTLAEAKKIMDDRKDELSERDIKELSSELSRYATRVEHMGKY